MADKSTLVRRHTVASWLALLGFAAWVATDLLGAPEPFAFVGLLVMLPAIIVMFATRKADEYVASLWAAGANTAFLLGVAYLVFAPFAVGFYSGWTGNGEAASFPAELASTIVLGAFLLGYFIKRFRGF
ncbi:hypothetical protein [Alteriqipengyuania lutimaris]|uniref:Uncharacterized protein n=1 Tax=Alteriqipengyuania lutimaris TaxID=1538146 RepID=A0A395LLZ8_9SPHN|nr:hypothetical protein [Alteriqipengyuania lutimaris]MBB3032936.1 glucan phosphoethanolaminetransferase (alkaline phosphatase superfamily) [Alteriqipengyuania lutimaris]RDS77982.1 hypothetical protein DL238_10475 [Alteriqipengyuania lutimaris]